MACNDDIVTNYLRDVYNVGTFELTVVTAKQKLEKFMQIESFDAIAFTGNSGAALAYPLSYLLRIPLICVRKSIKSSHFKGLVEGCYGANRYIIIDDFVATGSTIKKIQKAVKKFYKDCEQEEPTLVGLYLYSRNKSPYAKQLGYKLIHEEIY